MSQHEGEQDRAARSMQNDWNQRASTNPFYAVDSVVDHQAFDTFYERGREIVMSEIDPVTNKRNIDTKTARVLEIGCGMGRLFPGLADRFLAVSGIDISTAMIDQGKAACPIDASWFVGDGSRLLGVDSESIDYVLSFEMFQHINSLAVVQSYVHEIARVLVPGGSFQIQMRQGSDTARQDIVRKLPRPLRVLSGHIVRIAGITPVKGDIDTWLGSIIAPDSARDIAASAGLTDLEIIPDTFHLPGMGYWLVGSKPR